MLPSFFFFFEKREKNSRTAQHSEKNKFVLFVLKFVVHLHARNTATAKPQPHRTMARDNDTDSRHCAAHHTPTSHMATLHGSPGHPPTPTPTRIATHNNTQQHHTTHATRPAYGARTGTTHAFQAANRSRAVISEGRPKGAARRNIEGGAASSNFAQLPAPLDASLSVAKTPHITEAAAVAPATPAAASSTGRLWMGLRVRTGAGGGGGGGGGGLKGFSDLRPPILKMPAPSLEPCPNPRNFPLPAAPRFSSSTHSASLYFFTHDTAVFSAEFVKMFMMKPGT